MLRRSASDGLAPEPLAESAYPGRVAPRRLRFRGDPTLLGWTGIGLSLLYLYRQLGCATPKTLGVWISSDTLWLVNLFTDTFDDHYSLSGWHFSIAPCWFPDVIAAGVFWILTRNVILATLLAGFVQVGLIGASVKLFRRAVGMRSSVLAESLLLGTIVWVTLAVGRHPGNLYPPLYQLFLPQTHVGSLLVVLYALGLALLLIGYAGPPGRTPRLLWVAYAILCLLGGMSNLMFFVQMLLPLTASVGVAVVLGMLPLQDCYRPVAIGWATAPVGAVLNRVAFNTTSVMAQAGFSYDRALNAFDVFTRGALAKLWAADRLHLAAALWALICIVYFLYAVRLCVMCGREKVGMPTVLGSICVTCFLFSGGCSVAAIIIGGTSGLAEFKDYVWSMHYLHPVFVLPIFGLPVVIACICDVAFGERISRRLALVVALAALLAPAYRLTAAVTPNTPVSAYVPPLVQFMDELGSREGLRQGYAGYWQARLVTLLSRTGLRAYAVDGSLMPLLWVSNKRWYEEAFDDRTKRPRIDFVILDDPLWRISREAAVRALGEPSGELSLKGTRVLIYRNGSNARPD